MKKLTKSLEDYLETIYLLEKNDSKVKSVQIANTLAISKPAVTKAMNELKELGYILNTDYTFIQFTEEGRMIAKKIFEKHLILKAFLVKLGVSEEVAEVDCCKIEHILSEETFHCVKNFLNKD